MPIDRGLRRAVGCALRYLLARGGMTQGELAHRIGASHPEVSRWCMGRALPRPKSLARALAALKVDHAEFCALVECPEIALFDSELVVAVASRMPLATRERKRIVRFINRHGERKIP